MNTWSFRLRSLEPCAAPYFDEKIEFPPNLTLSLPWRSFELAKIMKSRSTSQDFRQSLHLYILKSVKNKNFRGHGMVYKRYRSSITVLFPVFSIMTTLWIIRYCVLSRLSLSRHYPHSNLLRSTSVLLYFYYYQIHYVRLPCFIFPEINDTMCYSQRERVVLSPDLNNVIFVR